jgi:hypothetical protein
MAATSEHTPPQTNDGGMKRFDSRQIQRHCVVLQVSANHRPEVCPDYRKGVVQAALQFPSDCLELRLPPLSHRLTLDRKPPVSGPRADVREAEKGEGGGFAVSTRPSAFGRDAAKLE